MRKYELDAEKSKSVFDYCKHALLVKECYNNVFKVFDCCNGNFYDGKWKVAYGYVSSVRNILCRHCFIIDENGKAIDPTIYTQNKARTDREYYAFKVFDDVEEYLNAIEKNNLYPALDRVLQNEEKQAHEWALDNGYFLAG